MNTNNIVFLDTETTGLDRDLHEIWELAYDLNGEEIVMHFPVDISSADPKALSMNGFWERYPFKGGLDERKENVDFAVADAITVMHDLRNKHIMGAVPNFDDNFLWKLMKKYGLMASWHYHLIDIENLIVGHLMSDGHQIELPWNSNDLSSAIGVDPESFDRHSAIGDVRWVKAQYEALLVHKLG